MEKFLRGESVRLYCEIRNMSGTLYDPDTVTASVYDPLGTAVEASASLSQDSQGIYSGSVTSDSTWMRGHYTVVFEVTVGADLIYDTDEFDMEVIPE